MIFFYFTFSGFLWYILLLFVLLVLCMLYKLSVLHEGDYGRIWQYTTFLSSNFSMSDGFVHLETVVVIFGNANVYVVECGFGINTSNFRK